MFFQVIIQLMIIGHSPYTKKSIDYVLSTTKDDLNTWVTVKANVKRNILKNYII